MINNDLLRLLLAVALLASAVYNGYRMVRSALAVARVNFGLHALMSAAMMVIAGGGPQFPVLPQVTIFALATWWFAIQASAHRQSRFGGMSRNSRVRCYYHGLMMAATAYMAIAMHPQDSSAMAGHSAAMTMALQPHHLMGGQVQQLVMPAMPDLTSHLAMAFFLVFAAALALWLGLLVRSFRTHSEELLPGPRPIHHRAEVGFEVVGAAIMAIMFIGMAS